METTTNTTLQQAFFKLLKSLWWQLGLITFLFGLFLVNNTYFGVEPFVALVFGWILGNIVGKSFGKHQIFTSRKNEILCSVFVIIPALYFSFAMYASAITEQLSLFPWTLLYALYLISISGLEIVSGTIMQTGYSFTGLGMWVMWIGTVGGFLIAYSIAVKVNR